MKKLVIVSDSPGINSGLGRVVRELAPRFQDVGVETIVAGWFHQHVQDDPDNPWTYPIYPCAKEVPETVANILVREQPDHVLAIGDPWDFQWLAKFRTQNKFMLCGYLNIEAAPVVPMFEPIFDAFDHLATTSEFGARVIDRRHVRAVHHGVDRGIFMPKPKPNVVVGRPVAESFVILVNAQNVPRKNILTAISGFARFANGKNDVLLYINSKMLPAPGDPLGHDLGEFARRYDVNHLICFNKANQGPLNTVDDMFLAQIYSMADVLLVTSHSEGFCLPVLEAMACGVVPIAPNAYSMPELLIAPKFPEVGDQHDPNQRGLLIPVSGKFASHLGTEHIFVSEAGVADRLEEAYRRWKTGDLAPMKRSGLRFAMSRPWDRTFNGLYEMMRHEPTSRVADGHPVDAKLRTIGRKAVNHVSENSAYPNAMAVLKFGGVGDMLQTTVVVRAAYQRWKKPLVVFSNKPEVFEPMDEVALTIGIDDAMQDMVIRSLADLFDPFIDIRYVSRAYGPAVAPPTTDFFRKHRWFYDQWMWSKGARLADLGMHSTEIMLTSLGLEYSNLRPIYDAREGDRPLAGDYIAVATGVGSLADLKKWPESHWKAFGEWADMDGVTLVQVGGEKDFQVPGAMDCRGLSLPRTATILQHAKRLVAVEGGMAHLAAATRTDAVVIFGPTDVGLFGYGWNTNLSAKACRPCWWDAQWPSQTCARGATSCLNFPSLDDVVKAVKA